MTLRLHDTFARRRRPFAPLHAPVVGINACGPTVYDHANIGNLRTFISEDVLRRVVE